MGWIREIGRLLLVLVLQVLLFDHLHLSIWGFPMVYIIFLLGLSPRIPRWAEMLIGFGLGIVMDIWHTSMGVHTAACVAVCFLRPILLASFVQDIDRVNDNISSLSIGLVEYIKCVVLLTVIHHFIVFLLEAWSMHSFWMVLLQTMISSLLTVVLILGYDWLKR